MKIARYSTNFDWSDDEIFDEILTCFFLHFGAKITRSSLCCIQVHDRVFNYSDLTHDIIPFITFCVHPKGTSLFIKYEMNTFNSWIDKV